MMMQSLRALHCAARATLVVSGIALTNAGIYLGIPLSKFCLYSLLE